MQNRVGFGSKIGIILATAGSAGRPTLRVAGEADRMVVLPS